MKHSIKACLFYLVEQEYLLILMESEAREVACIVNDMSDMVVVDLDSTVTAELDTEDGLPEEARNVLDVAQGMK